MDGLLAKEITSSLENEPESESNTSVPLITGSLSKECISRIASSGQAGKSAVLELAQLSTDLTIKDLVQDRDKCLSVRIVKRIDIRTDDRI